MNIILETKIIGVVDVSISLGVATKTSVEVDLADLFNQAEKYMYDKKLDESQMMREKTLANSLEKVFSFDFYEEKHAKLVSKYAANLGKELELEYESIDRLAIAGYYHDVGKVTVDPKTLTTLDVLDQEQIEMIRQHTKSGYHLLKSIDGYSEVAEIVLAHHEKWNGKGYPKGLSGDNIPFEARVLHVAEAIATMEMGTHYKMPMTRVRIMDELHAQSGSQFDPRVAEVGIRMFGALD